MSKIAFYQNEAIEKYKKLTDEQKEFVAAKKITASMKPKRWIQFLEQIAQMDSIADKSKKKLVTTMILSFIAAFILLFFLVFLPLILVEIVLLFIGIRAIVVLRKLKKIDLSNELRDFLMPLLIILREDLHAEKKIYLKLDFSPATDKTKLIETIPNSNRRYPKVTTLNYQHAWMVGKAYFVDGSEIQWEAEDLIRHRKIVKRSASGKIKSKEKYKIKHKIRLDLKVEKTQYSLLPTNTPNILQTDVGNEWMFSVKSKQISTSLDDLYQVNNFLALIALIYQKLQPKK